MAEINRLLEDVRYVAGLPLPWERLENKKILISGASGMIGSFLIHVLMERRERIEIIALGRSEEKAKKVLGTYWNHADFSFISHDINLPLKDMGRVDYMLHAASNTHPVAYATDPIGTITTNVLGLLNMLEYGAHHDITRFLFASSVEIYGENRGDKEYFDESYCGYIDCNTARAGYSEGKRTGEALCQAYRAKCGMDIVIARLSRTYGPTMQPEDSKAAAQFIKNAVCGDPIVLKSAGNQFFSYSYVADAVSGILTILLKGIDGEAYNIADHGSDITLRKLAELLAEAAGSQVVTECPDAVEQTGFSKATRAVMTSDKIRRLGWQAGWNIQQGMQRTLEILKAGERQGKQENG